MIKRRGSVIIFRNSGNVNMVINVHLRMKQMDQTMKKSSRVKRKKGNLVKSASTSRNSVDVNMEMNANFLINHQQATKEQVN